MIGGLTAGVFFLLGALDLAGAPVLAGGVGANARLGLDIGTMASGFAAAALVSRPLRERLARVIPIDPDSPVHALALVLAVILFGTQITSVIFTNVLASDQSQAPLSLGDLVLQEIPFLILGLAGVGIFTRRNTAAALERLGVVVPKWWQVPLALATAGLFFGFGSAMDALNHTVSPQVAQQVDVTTQHVFGGLGGPFGIAALALAPGICEEILFRGALQPRLGIVPTALLFTSIHTQYGFSLDLLAVFVLAIGLGVVRKYTNTTTSSLCHTSYNLLGGIALSGAALGVGAGVDLVLLALSAYGIWSSRRQRTASTVSAP
ncbi:MAG TPA: CPBP family intramembrane glutamic endopeptidase [Candidatus Baltobacterales bacterium]|nr:CPBP family intramembrane glutamic endopeptidase [Candidatus Baltobacterales bacterium]